MVFKKDPSDTCVGDRWIERDLTGFQRLQDCKRWYSSIETEMGTELIGFHFHYSQDRGEFFLVALALAWLGLDLLSWHPRGRAREIFCGGGVGNVHSSKLVKAFRVFH